MDRNLASSMAALALGFCIWACGDGQGTQPSNEGQLDASVDAAPETEAAADASPPSADDAGAPYDAGPTTEEDREWLAAEEFSIEFEATSCFGACPAFWVGVDERGHVRYRGTTSVARPGWYEVDVPPDAVRSVFEGMIETGFLHLQDRYVSASDGCSAVRSDGSTNSFVLHSRERMKQVVFYNGCTTPAQSFNERFASEIQRATTVGRFLYPRPSGASRGVLLTTLEGSWIVTDGPGQDRKEFGMLRIDADQHWTVADCDGQTLSSGDLEWANGYDVALLPPKAAGASFVWPGIEERLGVALLTGISLPSGSRLRLLSLTEQYDQWALAGSACGER